MAPEELLVVAVSVEAAAEQLAAAEAVVGVFVVAGSFAVAAPGFAVAAEAAVDELAVPGVGSGEPALVEAAVA